MLIEDLLPVYHAVERHQIDIAAPPERVYRAAHTVDFSRQPVIRGLLALRSLPSLVSGAWPAKGPVRSTLDRLQGAGFLLLGEDPPRELLLGVVGKFWTGSGGRCRIDPLEFRAFSEPGFAKAAWNFSLAELPAGHTRLVTETRVQCMDASARWRFRLYWLLVRPFSGLIRILMLREIKKASESDMSSDLRVGA